MEYTITSKEQLTDLWINIYDSNGRPDWSHIIPYYHDNMIFQDSVQKISGIEDFKAMTERLVKRSGSLSMQVLHSAQEKNDIFMEWNMTLKYKVYPESSVYGCSRITLNDDGKIIEQRDYYDLWGDIFDNIPVFRRIYRRFMHRKFG